MSCFAEKIAQGVKKATVAAVSLSRPPKRSAQGELEGDVMKKKHNGPCCNNTTSPATATAMSSFAEKIAQGIKKATDKATIAAAAAVPLPSPHKHKVQDELALNTVKVDICIDWITKEEEDRTKKKEKRDKKKGHKRAQPEEEAQEQQQQQEQEKEVKQMETNE
ncbi:uncharacterized protein FSUBG_2767 [Fusarium subglutinans]|uniref:Uncharacterized protein n=1 Tax=Gibberella subglutinans TaxID=42677 RepID=A0A8H5Q950_GIBSU|nr:uncharacterized protein FSUBG_2767 [Fusarium subglutinans]KAF5610962.1 hypothetical protein FSUBG_2767 [Fusarium subglutinans]